MIEGQDYYVEDNYWVFTEKYLLERGYCCDSDCRYCPYKKNDAQFLDLTTVQNLLN